MDKLANVIHNNNLWTAHTKAYTFESAVAGLIITKKQVTGDTGAALQLSYTMSDTRKALVETNKWSQNFFKIID